jgi:trehalose/maltose transport system substrate-binding protein
MGQCGKVVEPANKLPQRRLAKLARVVAIGGIIVLLLCTAQACKKTRQSPTAVTLTLIDKNWVDKESRARLEKELQQFTKESGIRVQILPAPEAAVEQLETWRKLLESGAEAPDVYAIDVIWPRILADNLVDLKAYLPAQEIAAHFPELIANNTVNGRLVALPYILSEGILFYRVDLLREYGYSAAPKTWEELESMAKRIQAGERAKGNRDFWGYVWEGAPSEGLTCNALEWQVSEGGGTILDENGRVTVNNPHTVRAWDRAARWVGSISPPGVIAYKEWDAFNVWQAGKAAFMRDWTTEYVAVRAANSPTRDRFDIAPLPRGRTGAAASLGGQGYGVSRHSLHPREAAKLVRFLCSLDGQARRSRASAEPPTMPQLYSDPEVLTQNPYFRCVLRVFGSDKALRPSRSAGKLYPGVSRAYFEAVHAVLSRQKSASKAAADLEDELQRILKAAASDGNGNVYMINARLRP